MNVREVSDNTDILVTCCLRNISKKYENFCVLIVHILFPGNFYTSCLCFLTLKIFSNETCINFVFNFLVREETGTMTKMGHMGKMLLFAFEENMTDTMNI